MTDHRVRLSWSRDHEGVITIYATDHNTGRIAEVADLWTRPMRTRLGWPRAYADARQQEIAEVACAAWNARNDESEDSK